MSEGRPLVVLIGAPGAGKTRIGKRIAKRLGVPFIDTDKRIVNAYGAIAAIFEHDGERYFRALERAEVIRALAKDAVVALGGGAVLDSETQRELAAHRVVQLTVTPEAAEWRIRGGKRPLVKSGIDAWKSLVANRAPIYDSLSDRTFDTSDLPFDEIAADIAAWITKDMQ